MERKFISGHGLAVTTIAFLLAYEVLDGCVLLLQWMQPGGEATTPSVGLAIAAGGLALLQGCAQLTAVVLICCWIYRCFANLPSLGVESLRYTPGWAVGWLFIPFANIYTPYAVMRELLVASQPPDPRPSDEWRMPTAPIVGWWWAAYLAAGVCGSVAAFTIDDRVRPFGAWLAAAFFLRVAAAVLCILLVRRIDQSQAAPRPATVAIAS